MKLIRVSNFDKAFHERKNVVIATNYLSWKDYCNRLKKLGWTEIQNGSHVFLFAPKDPNTGKAAISDTSKAEAQVRFSKNANWEVNFRKQVQDLKKISKDLDFVWETPFVIPDGFNPYTLKIEEKEKKKENTENSIYFYQFPQLQEKVKVFFNGEWKVPVDFDYAEMLIMFNDGSLGEFRPDEPIMVKAKNEFKLIKR